MGSRGNRKTDFPLTQKDWSRLKLSGVGSCQPRLGPQGRWSGYEINLDKLVKCYSEEEKAILRNGISINEPGRNEIQERAQEQKHQKELRGQKRGKTDLGLGQTPAFTDD